MSWTSIPYSYKWGNWNLDMIKDLVWYPQDTGGPRFKPQHGKHQQ